MTSPSLYKKYEDATRHYYGADKDPLRFVPVVSNPEIAHDIAIHVNNSLDAINDEELTATANRIQARNKYTRLNTPRSLEELKEEALQDRLARIVVNSELQHAAEAPGDFNEDSEQSGAYKMGIGIVISPSPPAPPSDRHSPPHN